jgi:hypothetical protein
MDKELIVSGFIQINNDLISADDIEPLSERSGSTCLCYLVRYQGKRYFMKRLRREYADNPRYQELFRKEYETGQRLTHIHLAEYVSMGEDVDGCYIVMEYIDGETLGDRMIKNPSYFANPKHVRRFFSQLLECLGYLHHHQVLHLDLKPDNIMLTRISDDVKLIDLGFCYSDSYDLSMGRNGLYSAPEQKEGKISEINVGTDLYAVGLLLRDLNVLFPKIYGSDAMKALIEKSTQAEPALRFSSAEEMADALRQAFPEGNGDGRNNNWVKRTFLRIFVSVALFLTGAVVWHFIAGLGERKENSADFDSNGISYSIASPDTFTCSVTGRAQSLADKSATTVMVRPFVVHEDMRYRVVMIGDSAFHSDSIIEVLSVSEGVERLSFHACSNCNNLHTVSLPISLMTIGESAFRGCHSLQHIILPPYLDRLPIGMFMECSSLKTIHFPEGLENIGRGCFASSGLTEAHLPDSLRSLEQGVFFKCRSLRSVTLPASLERIGDFCFHNCDSLIEVVNYSVTPQPITNVFKDTTGLQRTLYVPAQSIDLYRKAPFWRDFSRILPL